jgi:biotin synthase-related radical SAM superfamily protein
VQQGKIRRVCIQALNYHGVFADLETLVREIKRRTPSAVSVSCQPLNRANIERLAEAGVDRLGIALDAATETLFDRVKGSGVGSMYHWDKQFRQLNEALAVFGKGNVSTHIIVGLGETEQQVAEVIQKCLDMGVLPALFAFTPVRGTALEGNSPPNLASYRRVQLARFLIVNGKVRVGDMCFDAEGKITGFGLPSDALEVAVASGLPFRTSGCPDCNRPFYNEKPSGPLYNYAEPPNAAEIEKVKKELGY